MLNKSNHPESNSRDKKLQEKDKRNRRIPIKAPKNLFVIIPKDLLMMPDQSYQKDHLSPKIKTQRMILMSPKEKDMNRQSSNNIGTKRKSKRKLSMTEFQMRMKVKILRKNTRRIQRSKMMTSVLTWINI